MNPKAQHSDEKERILREYERRELEIPADYYSFERAGNLFIYTQRIRKVIGAMARNGFFPLGDKKILEVGCGRGNWLVDFESWGAVQEKLCGIDLNEKSIAEARRRLTRADLRTGDASQLPWPDSAFDLVLQATVFTSILSAGMKQKTASEMARVLNPGGIILWCDFRYNNPWNPHVRGVRKEEIAHLFQGMRMEIETLTLIPPLARRLAPFSWTLCHWLGKIPFLNSHYLAVIRKSV